MLKRLLRNKAGVTSIEYALIASLISVAAMAGYTSLGEGVSGSFNNTADTVGDAL